MRQVVCLSGENWECVPNRTQQLMSRMKDAQVLFFQPPAPHGSSAWKQPGQMLRPDLYVYTLPPVCTANPRHRFLLARTRCRLTRFIQKVMDHHHFREPLLWTACPAASELLDSIAYRGLVYDCYRDWPDYPVRWESDLAMEADVVFAASPSLVDHIVPCCGNPALLPNGANHQMFAKDDLPRPAALRGLRGPVVGYMGTLWPDLDLVPALEFIRSRPDCTLILIGPDRGNPLLHELRSLPNVRWLDFIPPVELPDYLCNFDALLFLLRRSHLDDDVIQGRMFEYLSTGRPIVAMLRPGQIEHFPDVVYGAHTYTEFVSLCSRAITETGRWAVDRRRAYGRAAAWSERAREVNRILESIGLLSSESPSRRSGFGF